MDDCWRFYDFLFVLQAEQKMALSYKTQQSRETGETERENHLHCFKWDIKIQYSCVCVQFVLKPEKRPKQRCELQNPYCNHMWTKPVKQTLRTSSRFPRDGFIRQLHMLKTLRHLLHPPVCLSLINILSLSQGRKLTVGASAHGTRRDGLIWNPNTEVSGDA